MILIAVKLDLKVVSFIVILSCKTMTITGKDMASYGEERMIYLRLFLMYRRVEPSVEFYCDLDYDPFLFMQENNKKYGK